MPRTIVINAVIWVFCSACSILAIWLTAVQLHAFRRAIMLSVAALAVSAMGFTTWTPFGRFPEIGYTHSGSDSVEIFIRSGWLYLFPLALGTVGLVMAFWKQRAKFRAA